MILLHMELSRVVALMVPVVPHFWGTIASLLTRICSIIGASCYFHLFIAIKIHCFCLDILWYVSFFSLQQGRFQTQPGMPLSHKALGICGTIFGVIRI